MSIADKFREMMKRFGLRHQTAAQWTDSSPSALTRTLQRADDDQTIGQIRTTANGLGLDFTAHLHDSGEFVTALQGLPDPDHTAALHRSWRRETDHLVAHAAETELRHAMASEYPATSYRLTTLTNNEITVIGWHLGQTQLDQATDQDDMADVYWMIYTDFSTWKQPHGYGGRFDNLLFHDPFSRSTMTGYQNHSLTRLSVHRPTPLGRTYTRLINPLIVRPLGLNSTLTSQRNQQGQLTETHLIIGGLERHINPVKEATDVVQRLLQLAEEAQVPPVQPEGTLRSRIESVQRLHGVRPANGLLELLQLGVQVEPDMAETDIDAAFDDVSKDSLIRFARHYYLSPAWLLDGVTARQGVSSLLGWNAAGLIHTLRTAQTDGTLRAVYLLVEGEIGAPPAEQRPVWVQFAWALQHQTDPDARVYDFAPAVRWDHHSLRMTVKAMSRFIQALSVPFEVKHVQADTKGLIAEVLQARTTQPLAHEVLLAQYGGMTEHFRGYGGYTESVEQFYEQLNRVRPVE